MNKRRIVSLVLSIMMVLQIIIPQVPLQAQSSYGAGQMSEGQKVGERSEIFAFKNTRKPRKSWFTMGTMSLNGARQVSTTRTETLKITTEATGLDEGDKEFDWKAFGQNKKFTAWIEVAYEEDKKPGEKVATQRYKVSEDFEISAEGEIEAKVTVDASKKVDYYFLKTEYDTDDAAFKINAVLDYAGSLSPTNKPDLTFSIGINQIVSTKITYNLIDEYGKAIDLNDAKEEKPADTDLKNLGKIGDDISFNLKKQGEEILWKENGLDEWDLMDSSLALSLTANEINSNNIDYKLSSTYDVLNGGKVTIKRQKDAVTPKDPQNPGPIPDGYARINLSADATGAGPTGTFTKDDPRDNQRVVDVRAGKPYTTAQAEVDKVSKPFPLTSANKVDTGKVFDKWTPELSTLGDAVAKETKTLNATYKSSDKEIIPYLPGEEVPTKDKDGLPIPENYVNVTFKSESATKGKVKIDDKKGETVLAKVKPGIDLSKKAEITTVPAENYGFTEWKPALTNAAEGQTYTAYFVKSGDKINEGDPIPKGWLKVTVSQDESIVDNTVEKAIYTVKSGDKLGQDKFVDLKGKAKDGYKDPAWYVGSEKLEKPYEKEITTSTDFLASATEEIANKFKTNGLKAVDITAYKDDKMGEKFWNKGVTTQKEDPVLERILAEATVTDTTDPARTTDKAGTFPGTLKVTFEDGSSLEVQNQKLIVIDTKVDIDYSKDSDKDANAPRHKDEVVKGKIKSDETLEGAKVEILDSENNVIGTTIVTKIDGSFIAGTRPLEAGETIKVRVTLPKADKASDPVEKVVGLNPDELNSILPTADKVAENFKNKDGVDQTKVATLEKAIKEAYKLVDKAGKDQEQKDQKAKAKTPSKAEQDKLDNAYKAIKAAIKDLTENKIPEIKAPAYKEIFVGDEINLDEGVTVTDDNIKQVEGKDYSYKIYDASGAEVKKEAMVAKDGVYRVVYTAEDTQGVKAEDTMTVVVKKTVVEVPGEFPDPVPNGYVKVEFKSGDHAGLNGVSKFLVKKDSPKSEVKEPEIIPREGYKVDDPKWSDAIPDTFANNFETTAQVLKKVTTDKPAEKDKDKYATLTFEAGDHGKFDTNAKTTIYVLKNEEVKFNAPGIVANEGFTFAKWDPELKESYTEDTKHVAQYASNSDISDTEVKGFQEVKFVAGDDGHFGNDVKEKSVWVRPGKLVDLRTKAPTVTVTTKGKSHIGWDKDLVNTFTKAKDPTVINAKYDDTVKTTEPDAKDKDKYAKVDFVAGNLGTIDNNQTTTFWVVKDAEVTSTFKAPTVTAKKGWKVKEGKDAWSPQVATKYTQDTIHVAQYEYTGKSVVPQEPGEDKPLVPDNFVKVEFKKGEHGIISSEHTTVYWVDPTKEVELTAPAVIADTNYKHIGWKNDKADVDLTKANKFEKATDLVAQYKSTVVTENPNDENYVTVEFKAGDHGTLTGDAKFWVYKNEKVSITAPTVTAKAGYTFNKWEPAVKDSYAEKAVHNATYTTNNNVSDTEVEGYNKVTFKAGDHGTLTEKSVWVKPDTLVDLNDKAPKVTPAEGYSHIGWKPALIGKFADGTDVVAQYSDSISDKPVEGWTEILFNSGEHGRFENGTKNTIWVNPDKAVALDKVMKDKLVPYINYSFDKWIDANSADADLATPKQYKEFAQFTATYKSNVIDKDEYDKLPEDEKKNFVQITFAEGEHGKFPKEAVKEVYVKKDVEVDLTEKAPTVIPNQGYGHSGWEPALKGTFTGATTITAQYKEGTFNEKAIKEITVLGPTKMGYGVGDKLDLTGIKIIAKDDAGLQKTYDGLEAITKAGFTVEPANETVLTKDHNGQPIKVSKGEGQDKVEGKTETTLTVYENKSAKAENVKALNQNKVDPETKEVTDQAKDTTTVTGKAPKGSTVIIKDENGKDITPTGGVKLDPNTGEFTAEVTKQDEGKTVKVIVTEPGKKESDPAEATVERDANNNGKADKDENFDIDTATEIEIIQVPFKMEYNQGENLDPKGIVVVVKDAKGATKHYNSTELEDAGITISPSENLQQDTDNDKPLVAKLTRKDNKVIESQPTDEKLKVGKAKTPAPTKLFAGNQNRLDPDGNVTATENNKTTIKFTVENKPCTVYVKYEFDGKTVTEVIDITEAAKSLDITQELQNKLPIGTVVSFQALEENKEPSDVVTTKVVRDADNDGEEDKEKTKKPTITKANKDEENVTGTAAPKADITITITPKATEQNPEPKTKTVYGKADENGNFDITTGKLVDGDKVVVIASEPGKLDNTSDPKTVGVNTTELGKSINKAEEIGGKDGANLDDKNPIDKELKDALDKGKKVKAKGDAGDPDTDQDAVDKAKEDLDKAIAQKEADTAVDKAKDSPTTENIKDAQDKIDEIPGSKDPTDTKNYNPIKKELQDKLDLIKKIKDGEDRLKEDDVTGGKDGKTPKKPANDIKALEDAVKDAKDALNSENKDKYVEKKTAIENAITTLNQERIKVGVDGLAVGIETLHIVTSVPGATVIIKINDVEIDTITTDGFGTFAKGLDAPLPTGAKIELEASRKGYNNGKFKNKVK